MTDNPEAALHADEAELIRWLDGALSNEERAALEAHVASCAECSARRRAVTRRSVRVSNLLRTVDMPAPATPLRLSIHSRAEPSTGARFTMPARWRVAAVLTLALAGAAAVPPVRAWVVGIAKTAWALASGAKMDGGLGRTLPDSSQASGAGAVAFTPAGSVLTIRAPERADARLTVEVVEGDRVSAVGSKGQAVPGLLVLPDELRIEEQHDGPTDYLVRVPLRLKTIRILIGATREETFRPSAVGERKTIPLTP